MPDELAVDRRPLLVGSRHDRLPLGIEYEHAGRRLHQTRAAADAALALHAHRHGTARVDAAVARRRPFFRPVERGDGRPITFLDHFAQVIKVEGRDVLDAWVDIVDRRRGPLAQSQLENGLHRDLPRSREHRREAFVLRVRAQGVRRGHVHGDDHIGAEDARRAHRQVVYRRAAHVEPPADLAGGAAPRPAGRWPSVGRDRLDRPRISRGGRYPGSAQEANTASFTGTSSSPSSPQKTCIPEFKSTVLTTRRWRRSWKVTSPTRRCSRVSSGSRRNRAGERIRLNAMSACATAKISLRTRPTAISCSSAMLFPADQAAPTSAPTLDPTICDGTSPRSVSACSTPTWATPFMPPPPSTRVNWV